MGRKVRGYSPVAAGVAGMGEDVIRCLLCRGQKWEAKL